MKVLFIFIKEDQVNVSFGISLAFSYRCLVRGRFLGHLNLSSTNDFMTFIVWVITRA